MNVYKRALTYQSIDKIWKLFLNQNKCFYYNSFQSPFWKMETIVLSCKLWMQNLQLKDIVLSRTNERFIFSKVFEKYLQKLCGVIFLHKNSMRHLKGDWQIISLPFLYFKSKYYLRHREEMLRPFPMSYLISISPHKG